jgi:hypothetical protein
MEIELDPIASLLTYRTRTRARAHGRGRFGLRHPKPQARLNNPMTEKELRQDHHESYEKNLKAEVSKVEHRTRTLNSARCAAARAKTGTLKT